MRMLLLFVLVLLAGCTSPESEVEDTIRSLLNDPASARFESLTVSGEGAQRVACGLVNAKNAAGGYPGARSFMVKGSQVWLASNSDESFAITVCCDAEISAGRSEEQKSQIRASCEPGLPEPIPTY